MQKHLEATLFEVYVVGFLLPVTKELCGFFAYHAGSSVRLARGFTVTQRTARFEQPWLLPVYVFLYKTASRADHKLLSFLNS